MDHIRILKRAWKLVWSYRVLWVFGILVALTSGGNRGSNTSAQFSDGGNGGNFLMPPGPVQMRIQEFFRGIERLFGRGDFSGIPGWILAFGAALACLAFILIIVSVIVNLVSATALIRLVSDYEDTGEKKTVGQGFRMGWSRAAWRLFLISLVIIVPIIILTMVLIGIAMLPLLAWTTGSNAIGILGTVAAIGLLFLVILGIIVVATITSVLLQLAWRAAALDDMGVMDAIREGWRLIREHLKDVGLMWLIMFGIGLAFAILSIPIVLLLLVLGGVSGGLVLLLVRGLVGVVASTEVAWIIGALFAAPLFILVLVVPLVFVGGLYEVFRSAVWTLTYRELKAAESLAERPGAPEVGPAAARAVPEEDWTPEEVWAPGEAPEEPAEPWEPEPPEELEVPDDDV